MTNSNKSSIFRNCPCENILILVFLPFVSCIMMEVYWMKVHNTLLVVSTKTPESPVGAVEHNAAITYFKQNEP